jgi:hypothetical protein
MKPRDRIQTGVRLYRQKLHPYWFARRSGYELDFFARWNYARQRLYRGMALNNWHQLHNYWGFWTQVIRNLEGFDEVVTRGGPIMVAPSDNRSQDRSTLPGLGGARLGVGGPTWQSPGV